MRQPKAGASKWWLRQIEAPCTACARDRRFDFGPRLDDQEPFILDLFGIGCRQRIEIAHSKQSVDASLGIIEPANQRSRSHIKIVAAQREIVAGLSAGGLKD